MNRKSFLWCVLIVLAVIVLGKEVGWIGVEKMTPVEAAAEPLVSKMPVGRVIREDPGYLGPDFFDRDRLGRNWDAAMDEIEGVTRKAQAIGDEQIIDALRPLVERLGASVKRMQDGNYDPLKEDQEITAVRKELRKMGLVKQ